MDDRTIIGLFWNRVENAITETAKKYGGLLSSIAGRILISRQDCEECVNDAYLAAWNAIPPEQPDCLSAYLGRITRNLALDRYAYLHAEKRNPRFTQLLDELADCIGANQLAQEFDSREIGRVISQFLRRLPEAERSIFLQRYWYCVPVAVIARNTGYTQSKIKSILFRSRNRLRLHLEKEGITV